MRKKQNRKVKVRLNKIILQVLLLILVLTALITQKENILNIFTNKNKIKAGIPTDMKIGDIILYDHKTGVKPEDLKTTIGKGTASIPGSGYHLKDTSVQEQTFDASNIYITIWRVFNIDKKNGEIMIVSNNIDFKEDFKTYGAIDYIWYEHNMHKIASIFGHGKGAKKKEFTYKVGSQLENAEDTAIWKTGIDGIPLKTPKGIPEITTKEGLKDIVVPLSGARPLRTEDIEKAFGWTESTIKSDSKFNKNSGSTMGYGGIYTKNIYFPQRDTGSSTQQWANKNIAKAAKQNVRGKDGYYDINKSNVPESTHRNMLWDWNDDRSFQLGQIGLDVYSDHVSFGRGMVYSYYFYSEHWNFAFAFADTDGKWDDRDYTVPWRVAVFLSASDIVYRKSKTTGAHQEQIWAIEDEQTLPKGMQIGDIVKYDHKATGVKIEDKRLANLVENQKVLKTTIGKGTASIPGSWSAYEQNFDANKIDTNWHVWGVDEVTGDVIIVSDSIYPELKTSNAIDYIWYEHNMHQIASIFGHGKGVKKKIFEYKVGSQLEYAEDTATWKTGIDGIPLETPKGIPEIKTKEKVKDIVVPLSGARPLRTEDIEKAFGWTESIIKSDSKFDKNSRSNTGYGGIYTRNIHFPQRDTGSNVQQWEDKNRAQAAKKDVKGKDGYYRIDKSNVPENNYKKVLWDWNNTGSKTYYQLGQLGLNLYTDYAYFSRGVVESDHFDSADNYLVYANNTGAWGGYERRGPCRVVAFLSSSDIIYRKTNSVGAHQEPVWDIELKNNPSKNIKVNIKNEFGKNLSGVKFNLNVDKGASVLSRANLNINSGSVNTFNGSNIVMKDNKYKMEVLGLPTGADYKIISKYGNVHELKQDIVSFGKEDLEYDIIIYRKDGDYVVPVIYEGGEKDKEFSLDGKIKLMDGDNIVDTLKVTLKKDNNEFKFTNVKYFIDGKFKKYTIKYEGEGDVKVVGNKLEVKYTPPKKNYTIKAEFIFDKTIDTVPVKLCAGGNVLKDINLLKSEDYIHVENLPERDSSGNEINYTIKKGNIPSGYITEISGLTITIRPVLTLPMSGSDSIKMVGITAGICVALGAIGRFKNKLIIFFKKYEIMK